MNSDAMFGSQTAAVRKPTWLGEASSSSTAISGSASSVIRSPNSDTACADQNVRNCRSRHRLVAVRVLTVVPPGLRCVCRSVRWFGSVRCFGQGHAEVADGAGVRWGALVAALDVRRKDLLDGVLDGL